MKINHKIIGHKAPKKIALLLHGYGANYKDMLSISEEILDSSKIISENILFICPNAPFEFEHTDYPTGRQWFSLTSRENWFVEKGLHTANEMITPYIQNILNEYSLPYKDLFLSGFSQGAMLALYSGIRINEKISGIISFSGTLLGKETIQNDAKNIQDLCLIHGSVDEVLPCSYSKIAHKIMLDINWNSSLHIINNLPHSINEECIKIATKFIEKRI